MTHTHPYLLTLVQGKRFVKEFRWPSRVKAYKQITAMPQKTPVRFTSNGHAIPNGWKAKVTGVRGPSQVNDRELEATVIDANTVEFNALNAGDLPDWAGGGYLEYFVPVDLTGYSGQIMLKENAADAAPALEISTGNGRLVLDVPNSIITLDVAGSVLTAMTKFSGVWDWEMTKSGVTVSPLGDIALPPWKLIREAVF